MLFTTIGFLLFYIIVYMLYWSMPADKRKYILAISSLLFYATWSVPFTFHFVLLIAINYLLTLRIRNGNSKNWLVLVLALNMINLFFFKYFYFFLGILSDATGMSVFSKSVFNEWLSASFDIPEILLPLAISFYTFQLTAYAIDVYRSTIPKNETFLDYFIFIMFFPQLIAGPIMRHSDFFFQLKKIRELSLSHSMITGGIYLLISGITKKILLADNLIQVTQPVFQNPAAYSWGAAILACVAFSFQLYLDFSGYTDLARGLGKLLALELPENFHAPYFSPSVRELWNNWHRTLTEWLRDYIYIPLGGHKVSFWRAEFNIVFTMTLCGLWHGASYNFLLLGLYHGVLIAIESASIRFFPGKIPVSASMGKYLKPFLVYVLLCAGFVLFLTPDFDAAKLMYAKIFTRGSGTWISKPEIILVAGLFTLLFHLVQADIIKPPEKIKTRYILLLSASMLTVVLLGKFSPDAQDFFYFQF